MKVRFLCCWNNIDRAASGAYWVRGTYNMLHTTHRSDRWWRRYCSDHAKGP